MLAGGAAAFNGLDFAAAEELAAAALDAKLGPEFWVMLACSQAKQGRKQNALASAAAGLAVIPGDQLLQQAAQWIESGSPDAPVKLQVSFAE